MPPRGKTPKRIGRSHMSQLHTPISAARKTPSDRSASKQLEDDANGSPEAFKTPKIPKRSTRVTKTPGWFSPSEDTFKVPSPCQNRRVTRRSTVFNIPEFSSFIPMELSPRRTRRSSVYQKKVEAPKEQMVKSAASRRSSMMPPKVKPPVSTRQRSVYKKKVNERIADNLTDTKIVKPSSRPPRPTKQAQFSPIKTRRQSMLPKAMNTQPVKPVVAPRKKVIEAPGNASKGSVVAQNAVPAKVGSVQRATMSSAAKAKQKSKSPAVVKRASSTTSLKPRTVKRTAESEETVFVKDLVSLSPKISKNSPNATLHKISSDIVLSPRGARTKTASRSATNMDLVRVSVKKTLTQSSVPQGSEERAQTPKTLESMAPNALGNTSDQLQTSTVNIKAPVEKTPRDSLVSNELGTSVVSEMVSQSKSKTSSQTPSRIQLTKTPSTTRKNAAAGADLTEAPSCIRKRRSAEKTPSPCNVAKKAKMDTSVYATPSMESPRVLLRKKVKSQIELLTSDTPEFLTPVGGNHMKAAYRKCTPMRPGMQNSLKLKTVQSSPSFNKKETMGIRPSVTRKTRLATKQMLDRPVIETTVAMIDGGDILKSEEFNKSDGLDFVDVAQIKEPHELDLVKTVEETNQVNSGKCTIL
ncbi:putative uncharacterized protein ENSP00000383309 [Lineus longissimus]|uniref:putative uncharacterized protein ENSP00000383309 n=1 Tax=Lineus longissimus TaxID=88925 RepID=UPI002B4CE32D